MLTIRSSEPIICNILPMFEKIRNKTKTVLLWSQRYTKTDMLYLAKGGFWLTSGNIVSIILAFFLAIVSANYLPKELFGTYKYVISMASIFLVFSLRSGMETSLTRSVARGYNGSLIPAIKASVKWGTTSGLISIAVAFYYFLHQNTVLGYAFLIIAGFLPLKDNLSLYLSWLTGKKNFARFSAYNIANQIISSATLILAIIFTQNLFLILLAYFAPRVAVHTILLIKTNREIPKDAKQDPETISYGIHLSVIRILSELAGQLDNILVWNSLGAAPLALYSFATAPTNQMRSLLKGGIFPLSFPKLAQRTVDELKKTLPRKLFIMLGFIAAIVTAYIFAAPYLFKIFFPRYMDSVFFSQIFALTLLFLPRGILTDAIVIHASTKKVYFFTLSSAVIKIVCLVILVHLFGILGAVFAYIVTELYLVVLSVILLFREKKDF